MVNVSGFLKKHPDFAAILLLAAAVFAVYIPALDFGHSMLDDSTYIQEHLLTASWQNFFYHLKTPVLKLYSPLVMHSYMLDHLLWGKEFFYQGIRLHNILLHCASAVLFYLCMRRFHLKRLNNGEPFEIPIFSALITALIWSLHPQRPESVIWLAERKDCQVIFLGMLSAYLFMRAYSKNKVSIAAPVCFALSFAVKPALLFLPLILTAGIWMQQGCFNRKLYLKYLTPYYLISLFYVLINFADIGSFGRGTAEAVLRSDRVMLVLWNFPMYIVRTLFPLDVNPLYPLFEPDILSALAAVIFAAAVIAVIVFCIRENPYQRLFRRYIAPLFFSVLVMLVPYSGLKNIGNVDFADRYSYMVSLAVWFQAALLLSFCLEKFPEKERKIKTLSICLPSAYLLMTLFYLPAWKNNYTMLDHSLSKSRFHPDVLRMAVNRAFFEKNYQEALDYSAMFPADDEVCSIYRKALESMILIRIGQRSRGLYQLDQLMGTDNWSRLTKTPRKFARETLLELANYHLSIRKTENIANASKLFAMLSYIVRDHDRLESLNFMGVSKMLSGDFKESSDLFSAALKLSPDDANIRKNLAAAKAGAEKKRQTNKKITP